MSFDKYLFEKYIKDCIVEIFLPDFLLNRGTGFWVLPDGHILTCYHMLIPKKIDTSGNEVEIENIDIENINIQIRYHGRDYSAVLDDEHSEKELDIAVLIVNEIDEKIHFVPLGEPELDTEVQVFGYRVVDGKTFKNGYHISGMLRSGQVLNEGGLVYNLETNQPPNSSVGGMSGSPVYDLNTRKVVGIQGDEERKGPSICYVHPIIKVYKIWPELRTKNFASLRKDFNIYFMSSDLPKRIFALSMALLQDQLEKELDKETISIAGQTLVNIGGEMVVGKLNKILGTSLGANKFMGAILRASKYFHNNCNIGDSCNATLHAYFHSKCINGDLCNAFTMPATDLLSIQAALNDLPKGFDQEGVLKAIGENLGRDYPKLVKTQIKAGLDLYLKNLKKELSLLERNFIFPIFEKANKQINQRGEENENKFNDVLANLEKYGAQRGVYMVLDDIYTGLGVSTIEEQENETHAQISKLEKTLTREASHLSSELSNWQPDEQPAYFLQQIYNGITDDIEITLRQDIDKLLTRHNQPWLAKYIPSRTASIKHPLPSGIKSFDSLSLVFTPDGKRIISSSPSGQILYLWDVESGQFVGSSDVRASGILCVAITSDGKQAIFASTDKIVRIWDIDNSNPLPIPKTEEYHICDISLIPKSQYAILAFSNGSLHLKNLKTGQTDHIFKGHKEPCSSIAMLSNGKFFISASDDTTLNLWETGTGKLLRTFKDHSGIVFCVAIIPNSNQSISASADRTLRLWDLSTGKCLRIFEGHSNEVHGVVATPDGKYALSASADKTLRLWEIATGKCQALFTGAEPFKCCAIAPNGSLIAAGDQAGEIHFLEIRNC